MSKGFSRNEANALAKMKTSYLTYDIMWNNWYKDRSSQDIRLFTALMSGIVDDMHSMDT